MAEQPIAVLMNRFFRGVITAEEEETLAIWIQESDNKMQAMEFLEEAWTNFDTSEKLEEAAADEILSSIVTRSKAFEKKPSILAYFGRGKWMRNAAAAAIFVSLAAGAWYFIDHEKENKIVSTPKPKTDIAAPVINKATITLSDGSRIYLDKNISGQLASQDNVELIKTTEGKIAYRSHGSAGAAEIYNTLTNPTGSNIIQATLSDGTTVWLNAGSTITYPVVFKNEQRTVKVNGEAYFDVARDASKPFVVSKGSMQVRVLGTRFNVNAYDEEPAIRVTLLDGAVAVKNQEEEKLLRPGEQAIVSSKINVQQQTDLEAVMAWRNGKFLFEEAADIKVIMRQIARWYDVEVMYEGNVQVLIGGSISRNEPLLTVLKKLELTGTVHFKVEGKKIIVKP